MKSVLAKQPDGTIQLNITIPSEKIAKTREIVIEEYVKNTDLPGFRKGKAPKKLIEEKLDRAKIREEILKKLLPETYLEAVQEHNLKPVISPKINLEKTDEGKDWNFTAFICEKPEVKLGKYKENIQKITARSKIIVPGKEQEKPKFEDIIKTLLENTEITIPKLLIDQEVERLLSQLLDDIKKLGLTLDQYLVSTGKTPESLRKTYQQKAEEDIKLEFVLQKIAEEEKIIVEQKEVDEAIQKAKDDKERKHLQENLYLVASILRQQKTLDFLKNL